MSGLRGTNVEQDSRFADKTALSLKNTKFPPSYDTKVDLRKINIGVLRSWIAAQVTALVGFEDDILVEFVFGMLESKETPMPDPRKVQISLTGFMNAKGAAYFMERLWDLLISAQNTPGGVPQEFIDAKKVELQSKQEDDRLKQEPGLDRRIPPPREYGRPSTRDDGGGGRFNGNSRQSDNGYQGGRPGDNGYQGRRQGDTGYQGGRGGYSNEFDRVPRDNGRQAFVPPRAESMRVEPMQTDNAESPRGTHIHPSRRQPSPRRRQEERPRERRPSPKPVRRGRSRSLTPPRRTRDRSDSRSPVRRPGRSDSRTPPRRRRDGSSSSSRSRSRSISRTPPRRQRRARSISSSPRRSRSPSPKRSSRRSPPRRPHRSPSRSASPPRRSRRSLSRSVSPPRRRRGPRSPSPERRRERRMSTGEAKPKELAIKGKARSRWDDE